MRTRGNSEPESTYRRLIAAIAAGEDVFLSRYGYGLLVASLLPVTQHTSSPPRRGEAGMGLGPAQGVCGDLLSPLD